MATAKLLRAAFVVSAIAAAAPGFAQNLNGALGGMRYDNWWRSAGLAEPQGTHPLYPSTGLQSGSATWRCVECHGWDYKGVDGAYGSGEHFTGIRGVLGSTKSRQQMIDLIKVGHGYQAVGMSDSDVGYLVDFIKGFASDTSGQIDASGQFVGSTDDGRYYYKAGNNAYTCEHCHGSDAADIVRTAQRDPWQFLHKVRFGVEGGEHGPMTSWLLAGGTAGSAAAIGRYVQAGLPGPAYVGDQACAACHADNPWPGFFESYKQTGHPGKLVRTGGAAPAGDEWRQVAAPPLPSVGGRQLGWSDVEYVSGNYKWKAAFIDRAGYVYTGAANDATQWNLSTHRWAGYNAGTMSKPFDCGACHTTGYSTQGNQHNLPGLIGTWRQDGVRCESCHGPGADHAAHPTRMRTAGGKSCTECHASNTEFRMAWKDGFMEDGQQGQETAHSPHCGQTSCATCHEPHRSPTAHANAIRRQCTDCHAGSDANNHYVVSSMPAVACVDCHMPKMGKSAESAGAFQGDVRGHIWRITTSPLMAAQNTLTTAAGTFWRYDARNQAVVTLDYACMACHTRINRPLDIQEASRYATGIHRRPAAPPRCAVCPADYNQDGGVDGSDMSAFFVDWESAENCADVNFDGGVDGADVETFFRIWETGAC